MHPEGNVDGDPFALQQFTGLCAMHIPNEAALPQQMPQTGVRHEAEPVGGSSGPCLDPKPLKQTAGRVANRIAYLQAYVDETDILPLFS